MRPETTCWFRYACEGNHNHKLLAGFLQPFRRVRAACCWPPLPPACPSQTVCVHVWLACLR